METTGKEMIVTVIEHDGSKWQVNEPVPGDATTKVVRIFNIDGVVEIFALPLEGTDLDKMKQGLHFTLMPLSIKVVAAVARFDEWQKIIAETEQALLDDGEDEEDEEDDEDDEDDDEPGNGQLVPPVQNFVPAPQNFLPPEAPQPVSVPQAVGAPPPVAVAAPTIPAPIPAAPTESPYVTASQVPQG